MSDLPIYDTEDIDTDDDATRDHTPADYADYAAMLADDYHDAVAAARADQMTDIENTHL